MVKKGDFLLQIDPDQAQAAVLRSEATVAAVQAQNAQSRANLLQAQKSLERSEAMKKANAQLVSDVDMEQLKTAVEVNTALVEASGHQVEQAQAALKDAKSALGKTTLFA